MADSEDSDSPYSGNVAADKTYEVGYGKPPKRFQFKKGEVHNAWGRGGKPRHGQVAERPEQAPPREVAAKSDVSKPEGSKADRGKADEPDAAQSDDAAAPERAAETKPQPTKKRRQSRRF